MMAMASLLADNHRFFGVASKGADLFIVTEFCPRSLQGWLEVADNREDMAAVRRVALDAARGMRYIHGRGVVVGGAGVRCCLFVAMLV